MIYLNSGIISITKAKPISDLIYKNRLYKQDIEIDEKIDIKVINKLFIDYNIKLYIGEEHRPNAMYKIRLKPTIINIYKHRND